MDAPIVNRVATCSIKDQLRPLGRPAWSILKQPFLKYSGTTSKLLQEILIRGAIFSMFSLLSCFFIIHITITETVCILGLIFYKTYFYQSDGDNTDSKLKEKIIQRTHDGTSKKRPVMKILGVSFAPSDTTIRRRIEAMCAALVSFTFLFAGALFTVFLVYLLFTRFFLIPVLYSVWYLKDSGIEERGGRRCHWFRDWKVWSCVADFFPVTLVKTADLAKDRNYIFGYHPHGIMSVGAFVNFATESTGFSALFKGITPHLMTLTMNFKFPIHRELVLLTGVVSVTKASLDWILKKKGKGNVAVIVVGGAQEALDAHRDSDVTLTLSSRKGFVKAAIQNGADLVPVFSFGENETFSQAPNPVGSKVREYQQSLKQRLGFSTPLFHARGLLQYTLGYVPYRTPIYTVVGAPIRVVKEQNPSGELVEFVHRQYVQALQKLYDSHKHKYGYADRTLNIS